MRLLFLGTGTSQGIPVIACDCHVCRSTDPRNRRLRPSVLVESGNARLLVDATPDFRAQMLRANVRRVDALLVTHTHADHFLGMDDLRAFTTRDDRPLPVFGSAETLETIRRVFPYACEQRPRWPSLPRFALHELTPGVETNVAGVPVTAVPVPHGRLTVYGFRFGRELAYVTDCHEVPESAQDLLRGVTVLVLDAVRRRPHPTHLSVDQAVAMAGRVGAPLTLLTHMCHEIDHGATEAELPSQVRLACDEMGVQIEGQSYRVDSGG